jgi:hypothetical protein
LLHTPISFIYPPHNTISANTNVVKQNTTLSSPDIPECGSLVGKTEKLCKASKQSHSAIIKKNKPTH